MSIFSRVRELEKRTEDLEKLVINLAQTVAELSEKSDEMDGKLNNSEEYFQRLFNEAADRMSRELNDGINQVLNFTPYGAK